MPFARGFEIGRRLRFAREQADRQRQTAAAQIKLIDLQVEQAKAAQEQGMERLRLRQQQPGIQEALTSGDIVPGVPMDDQSRQEFQHLQNRSRALELEPGGTGAGVELGPGRSVLDPMTGQVRATAPGTSGRGQRYLNVPARGSVFDTELGESVFQSPRERRPNFSQSVNAELAAQGVDPEDASPEQMTRAIHAARQSQQDVSSRLSARTRDIMLARQNPDVASAREQAFEEEQTLQRVLGEGRARLEQENLRLTPEQQRAVNSLNLSLGYAEGLGGYDEATIQRWVGFLQNRANRVGQLINQDRDFAEFQAIVGRLKASLLFSRTEGGGAALTDTERRALEAYIPTGTEVGGAVEFRAKLDLLTRTLGAQVTGVSRLAGIKPRELEATLKDLRRGLTAPTRPPESGQAPEQTPQQGTLPDGTPYRIIPEEPPAPPRAATTLQHRSLGRETTPEEIDALADDEIEALLSLPMDFGHLQPRTLERLEERFREVGGR